MSGRQVALSSFAVLAAVPLWLIARSLTFAPPPATRAPDLHWRGAFHVHSTRSHDGRGSIEEIAVAASRAGLRFVVLTEHDVPAEPARAVDNVLMISAVELGTPSGHVVSFGHRSPFERPLTEAPFDQIRARGGTSILAHPVQRRNPWRDWPQALHVDGLELYSGDTMFREATSKPLSRLLPAVFAALFAPEHALSMFAGDSPEARRRLLELSATRPRLALCANDAHGLPSYEASFRSMSMRVPAPPPGIRDEQLRADWILSRLSDGSAFCVFDTLGDPGAFEVQGLADRQSAKVGAALTLQLPTGVDDVEVRSRGAAATVLARNQLRLDAPGVLQLEVWRKGPAPWAGTELRPWIVSQPIRVTAAEN